MSSPAPSALQEGSMSSTCWSLASADIFGMERRSCTLVNKKHIILHLNTIPEGVKQDFHAGTNVAV